MQPRQGAVRKSVGGGAEEPVIAQEAASEPWRGFKEKGAKETTLQQGDSFGELSILYKMPMHATFTAKEFHASASAELACCRKTASCTPLIVVTFLHASTGEGRSSMSFWSCWRRRERARGKSFHFSRREVHILSPLLYSERFELACNAIGHVKFKPGDRVLHQGVVRSAKLWCLGWQVKLKS